MSYRTLLVHLNDSRRARHLLAHACEIARAYEAHMIGMHVFPVQRFKPPIPLPIGNEIIARVKASVEEEARTLQNIFFEATTQQRFVGEWRYKSSHGDPAAVVVNSAHAVDLVVASQPDTAWDMSALLDFPGRLAIECGRPVLVVPNDKPAALPRNVVVAWNSSRESARAVFDALPLIKGALQVEIVSIDEGREADDGALPAEAIRDALLRHGIHSAIASIKPGSQSAGAALCDCVTTQKADLLVMGAYGHARMREFVFGGATRHILTHMPASVLFSH